VCCNVLQGRCTSLQFVPYGWSVSQCVVVCCRLLPCVAVCCHVLPCVAEGMWFLRMCSLRATRVLHRWKGRRASDSEKTRERERKRDCSVLQCDALCCNLHICVVQCVAVCCSVMHCVAVRTYVCCSALQCVAVCCSVVHCVAVHK